MSLHIDYTFLFNTHTLANHVACYKEYIYFAYSFIISIKKNKGMVAGRRGANIDLILRNGLRLRGQAFFKHRYLCDGFQLGGFVNLVLAEHRRLVAEAFDN